jgi:hypothetical protein
MYISFLGIGAREGKFLIQNPKYRQLGGRLPQNRFKGRYTTVGGSFKAQRYVTSRRCNLPTRGNRSERLI